ncbi:MAG: DUF1003 domain-containing protein [Rhizobiales bacterium]|nr:DUF1003 domain-containing protein [Hyphomicrobiales bacterium]MBI3673777.1 DUF1003 domain-containing protein [Hyphomicrobiales bacterium]
MNTAPPDAVKLLAQRLLDTGYDDMPPRERQVIERVARKLAVSRNINIEHEQSLSFGDRIADRVAGFGGSWTFIIMFGTAIALWIALNSVVLVTANEVFDPYPYILLNLFLSMVAAVQAPVIMMSQNRLAAKDRLQAAHDYEVNLKAEIEIMALHEKLDEMRSKDLAELIRRLKP